MLRYAAVVGLIVALGVTGCSTSGPASKVASLGGPSASASAVGGSGHRPDIQQQQAALKFAQCMRQHGANMPDPKSDGGAMALPGIPNPQTDPVGAQKWQAAMATCAKNLPNGGQPSDQQKQAQLHFAQCMRQHGVNVPDPGPNSQGQSLNLSDPNAQKALQACGASAAGRASGN